MFLDDKIPYCFGDPRDGDYIVFSCLQKRFELSRSIKTELTSTTLYKGRNRLKGAEKFFADDSTFDYTFSVSNNSRYSPDYIYKLCMSGIKKMFFVQIGKTDTAKSIERILFNYVECINPPKEVSGTDSDLENKTFKANFRLINPVFYVPDSDNLSYFVPNQVRPQYNGTYQYDSTIRYGEYEINSFPLISTLTQDQLYEYIFDETERLPFSYKDKFLKQQGVGLGTDSTFTYSITNNNQNFVSTTGLDLGTTAENEVYLLKLETLAQGEYIDITNVSNNSRIRIKWLFSVANPTDLIYNSFYGLLYDINGVEINNRYYSVDSTDRLLYFSDRYGAELNQYNSVTDDTLLIQKSSSSNNDISIQTLRTFT